MSVFQLRRSKLSGLILTRMPNSSEYVSSNTHRSTHSGRCSRDIASMSPWLLVAWLAGAIGCSTPTGIDSEVPSLPMQVVAGASFSCVLDGRGEVVCWGRWGGVESQPAAATLPTRVTPGDGSLRFAVLSADSHICGLTHDGEAYCWGQNRHGQLGDGTTVPRILPTRVSTHLRFAGIAAGVRSTCALTRDGQTYCWGGNDFGVLGTGSMAEGARELRPVAVASMARFSTIAGGWVFCGVTTAGSAHCWGVSPGSFGPSEWREPGDCATIFYTAYEGRGCLVPTPVSGGISFRSVSSGGTTICGLAGTGAAYCWGDGWLGTLGNGQAGFGVHTVEPVPVAGGFTFQSVAVGATHACGLATDGRALCWGNNFRGYLGTGQYGGGSASPLAVAGGHRFESIAVGGYHTCAMTEGRAVWCWGAGTEGQLGRSESLGDSNLPIPVSLPSP